MSSEQSRAGSAGTAADGFRVEIPTPRTSPEKADPAEPGARKVASR